MRYGSAARFGRALVDARDLDPVYEMLYKAELDPATLRRWCIAYWSFYNAGVASFIAESKDFYRAMRRGAKERWPRGTERTRAPWDEIIRTTDYLQERFPDRPEEAFDSVLHPRWDRVNEAVRRWPGFGPWLGFKVADMADRVLLYPIDFTGCQLGFYKAPAAGLRLVAQQERTTEAEALRRLLKHFEDEPAPPDFGRKFGIPEIETILCKYKSHCKGNYPIGKDKAEVRHALYGWGPLSDRLSACLPK